MARKKPAPAWFLPGFMHKHRNRRRKFKRLRRLDGDNCWRCNHPMRFDGPPNCGKAATIEHLEPLSKGGTWHIDNLRLCHVGCNRYLGDRTAAQKRRMRVNFTPASQPGLITPRP